MADQSTSLSSMVFCWTLERRDGAGVALTSHDRSLVLEDVVHRPASAISPAAIKRRAGLDVEAAEVSGAFDSDGLSREDLLAGRWKGARTRLSAVSWADPSAASQTLVEGELGETTQRDDEFSAELIGATARLAAAASPTTTPECRASLGDRACRVDLAGRSIRATVIGAIGNAVTLDREVDGRFAAGRLRYIRGECTGLSSTILRVEGASVYLRDPLRSMLREGDVVELQEGCDRRLATCKERFGNVVNFRGEPHLPGNDVLTRYPGS